MWWVIRRRTASVMVVFSWPALMRGADSGYLNSVRKRAMTPVSDRAP